MIVYVIGLALQLCGTREMRRDYIRNKFNHYFPIETGSYMEKERTGKGIIRHYPKGCSFIFLLSVTLPKVENMYTVELNGYRKVVYVKGNSTIVFFIPLRMGESNKFFIRSKVDVEVEIRTKYFINKRNNITESMTDSRIVNKILETGLDIGPEIWINRSDRNFNGECFELDDKRIFVNHAFSSCIKRDGMFRMVYNDIKVNVFREVKGINIAFENDPEDFCECEQNAYPVECYEQDLYVPTEVEQKRIELFGKEMGCERLEIRKPDDKTFWKIWGS